MKDLVFVYGTLKEGFRLHGNMKLIHAEKVGEGYIKAQLNYCQSLPVAVPSEDHQLFGELYKLPNPETGLDRLDQVEGCTFEYPEHSMYYREETIIYGLGEDTIKAWVYFGGTIAPHSEYSGEMVFKG